jgi:MFS superfamily sulfate permease-like transporter
VRSKPTNVGVTSLADIQTIGQIHKDLKQAFERGGDVRLKLDAVTDADLTFVQLVESARRFAAAEGKSFAVTPAPDSLRELLERGGFVASPEDRSFWLGNAGGK